MAAFDLIARAPGMIQAPQTNDISNMMQFARSQQERRNQQDRLALDKKAQLDLNALNKSKLDLSRQSQNDLNRFNSSKLNLDQQIATSNINDVNADNIRADDNLAWLKSADARKLKGNEALNKAFNDASTRAFKGLSDSFQFDPSNVEAYKNDPRYLEKSPEEQAAFDSKVFNSFQQDAARHLGREKTEQALREQFAATGGTPEQVETQVQAYLTSKFPASTMNSKMLDMINKTVGYDPSTGLRKAKGLDDVGNIINEQEFVNDWYDRVGVESGTRSWFNPDLRDQDLNDNNLARYLSVMKGREFNSVQALTALDTIRDSDTIDVKFEQFIDAPERLAKGEITADDKAYKAYEKVMGAATNAKNLAQSGTQGQGQQSDAKSALFSILNQQLQPNGQPTTVLQRREIMLGMLGEKLKQAQTTGQTGQGIDEETTALIEALSEIEQDPVAEQPSVSAASRLNLPAPAGVSPEELAAAEQRDAEKVAIANQKAAVESSAIEAANKEALTKEVSGWTERYQIEQGAWKDNSAIDVMSKSQLQSIISNRGDQRMWKSVVEKAKSKLKEIKDAEKPPLTLKDIPEADKYRSGDFIPPNSQEISTLANQMRASGMDDSQIEAFVTKTMGGNTNGVLLNRLLSN